MLTNFIDTSGIARKMLFAGKESQRLGIDARTFKISNFEFVVESEYCKHEKYYFFDSSGTIKKVGGSIFGLKVVLNKAYLFVKTACQSGFSLSSSGGLNLGRIRSVSETATLEASESSKNYQKL